jgi:leader peptidase (prepilin peptidase)/N-methyltransferase
MPVSPLVLASASVVAAALGAVLGWWPLAAWARRELRAAPSSLTGVRAACAISVGTLWGSMAALFVGSTVPVAVPALFAFVACGTVLAVIDVIEQRLPNRVLVCTAAAVAVLLVVASAAAGFWMPLLGALLGGLAMFVLYLVIALLAPRSFGMGDVKLALPIGLLLGWFGLDAWLIGLVLGAVVGGVFAAIALVRRGFNGRGVVPYGPAMLGGAVLAVVAVGALAA